MIIINFKDIKLSNWQMLMNSSFWRVSHESFYYVNYGSSIIKSKLRQIISVIKIKHSVFSDKWYYKNRSFWHFNSSFVLKTTKTLLFVLITEIIWQTFRPNNWRSIIDVVERLGYFDKRITYSKSLNFTGAKTNKYLLT